MTTPSISVVMPVYNTEKYIADSMRSILNQTFSDFELIVVNDGSTDASLEIIKSFKDQRITVLENKTNLGNYATRNIGHFAARGKYICVMDADDLALPNRLEKQYAFMEQYPEVGIAGSCIQYVGSNQIIIRDPDAEITKIKLLANNYICHPSIIMRYELLQKYDLLYDESFWYAGDYDLMVRASAHFPVLNMGDVLLQYRWSPQQLSASMNKYGYETETVRLKQLNLIGITPTTEEEQIHLALLNGVQLEYRKKHETLQWIQKLQDANKNVNYFNQVYFQDFLQTVLNRQSFFTAQNFPKTIPKKTEVQNKIDLLDVTFVIPARIDSDERLANLLTLLRVIEREVTTHIIVLESDKVQFFKPVNENVDYYFIYEDDLMANRTKCINRLIELSATPIIAVWEPDAIVVPSQILEAVNQIRQKAAVLAFPYDGRYYRADKIRSNLFRQTLHFDLLTKNSPMMELKNGYYAKGGAFLVDKDEYLKVGGENEKLQGLAFVDEERVKRMEVLNLPIFHAKGMLFHLWHPKVMNRHVSIRSEIKNIKEYLQTCC